MALKRTALGLEIDTGAGLDLDADGKLKIKTGTGLTVDAEGEVETSGGAAAPGVILLYARISGTVTATDIGDDIFENAWDVIDENIGFAKNPGLYGGRVPVPAGTLKHLRLMVETNSANSGIVILDMGGPGPMAATVDVAGAPGGAGLEGTDYAIQIATSNLSNPIYERSTTDDGNGEHYFRWGVPQLTTGFSAGARVTITATVELHPTPED